MIRLPNLSFFVLFFSFWMLGNFTASAQAKVVSFLYLGRTMKLVIPAYPKPNAALLVLLHGCKQNPDIILEGTKMVAEAEKSGFYVLVPEQPGVQNIDHCWNWFFPSQQQRTNGNEMGHVISFLETIIPRYSIHRDRIFLAGMSAGGAMAHAMLACYPDYFKGVAIHSGLAFKTAESIQEANSVLMDEHQKSPEYLGAKAFACASAAAIRTSKIIILHGLEDKRVLPLHLNLSAAATEVMLDYSDDGKRNRSLPVATSQNSYSFPRGYTAYVTDRRFGPHRRASSRIIDERLIQMKGLGHAWGGGNPVSQNFDPNAPSSTDLILEFFGLK